MSNDVAKKSALDPQTIANRFKRYAESTGGGGRTNIAGHLLLFDKHGNYAYGQERKKLPLGTRMIVSVPSIMTGWVKWEDNLPTHRMGLVFEGYVAPQRDELGDNDPEMWADPDNDPWRPASQVIMLREGSTELFTFSTSSSGGNQACGDLAAQYAARVVMYPTQLPIVALQMTSYMHPTHPEYGEILKPIFELIGWVESPAALLAAGRGPTPAQLQEANEAAQLAAATEASEEVAEEDEPAPQPHRGRTAPAPQRGRPPAAQPQRGRPAQSAHGAPPRGKVPPGNGRRRREEIPY